MRATDRGVLTDIGAAALAYFDIPDLRALGRAVSLKGITRPQLAGFMRLVLDAARLGDPEAQAILDDGAAALAGLAQLLVEQLGSDDGPPVPVAFVGGAMENAAYRASAERLLAAATPLARIVPAFGEPALGAALLALDAAGFPRPPVSPI
jgi:N-acetylglucosamine kinase-like BadF-type ATPase